MKIAMYSSKRERCGISTYTEHIAAQLRSLGHTVEYFSSLPPYERVMTEILNWKPDVFHIQHEPSIMPPAGTLAVFAQELRSRKVRVALTMHTANAQMVGVSQRVVPKAEHIVVHRPIAALPKATIIPMPCPIQDAVPSKTILRLRYGFPEGAFVISTVGFLIPWKGHPKIVGHLLPWLFENPNIYLQVIASPHFNPDLAKYVNEATNDLADLNDMVGGDRIRHINGYPSDEELVDRLSLSDLGYTWCPMDTDSSSAAGAQFTAARCPLVATDSTHYLNLGEGIIRGPKHHMGAFCTLLREVASNEAILRELKQGQEAAYKERNYRSIARQHVNFYERMKA